MKNALALLALVALAGCDVGPPPMRRVDYEVSGNATAADITMTNAQGGTEQGRYRLPFRRTFQAPVGAFVYISAQNEGGGPVIACSIGVDGMDYKSSMSSGRYMIATCNGQVEPPG